MAGDRFEGKPRIKDIALEAGVSIATVSNVLNRRKQVNSEAGRRVLEIAQRMGYERAMHPQLRHCIRFVIQKKHGLVVMDTPFFAELISGIEQECHKRKYELIVTYIDMASNADAAERVQSVVSDDTTPVLLLATEMGDEDIAPYRSARVPVLVLDSFFYCEPFNTVVMNNVEAGLLATRHLIEMGHKRVGYIGSNLPFNNMRDRYAGYKMAMNEAGLEIEPDSALYVEPTLEGARITMQKILSERVSPLPTAFFAANDLIAVGCARAFKDSGLRIPDDVSLIGMDDMPICQIVTPPMSTITVPKADMGAAAVARLVQMSEHSDSLILKTQVAVTLTPRRSVKRM